MRKAAKNLLVTGAVTVAFYGMMKAAAKRQEDDGAWMMTNRI